MSAKMNLSELLAALRHVHVPQRAPEVCATIARELCLRVPGAHFEQGGRCARSDFLHVSVGQLPRRCKRRKPPARWVYFGHDERRRCWLAASEAHYLYAFWSYLLECCAERSAVGLRDRLLEPSFAWQRPVWDLYFTQAARSVRGLVRADYARQMARFGFTHLEVGALATPEGWEAGVPGEVYPRFYTYCAALDQFVDSFLNRGIYPRTYLRGNLERLIEDCRLARRYGLIPAMTCFEPRSVPEKLLARYPELRGARVDHPFRSFKPRYNLAIAHPVVRRHYRELVQNLLRAVPELGCLAIWSNDSGAGYEFTRSLYVGANGSAYLVREWSGEDVFVAAAARNVVEFLHLLRESAAEINPGLRVTTRLEPFVPEREAVLAGLGEGVDVEVASLFDRGWDSPYGHPRYGDCAIGPLTIYNNTFRAEERREIRALARRGIRAHFFHAHGPAGNFEPLLGIPAPGLCAEKLRALRSGGAEYLAHIGGVAPPAAVRWNLDEEVFRRFLFEPDLEIDATLAEIARGWAGARHGAALVRAWKQAERAIRGHHPNPLYFAWGVWYRLLTRPLVPDIERIPAAERRYYEEQMLATHHNPARFDLRRDVLFDLMTPRVAAKAVARTDRHGLPALGRAIEILEGALESAAGEDAAEDAAEVLGDQLERLRALRCWMTTQRNVAAWIAHVHGYLEESDRAARAAHQRALQEMITLEIENTAELLRLWERDATVFMAVSAVRETTFIHGMEFGEQLRRKIDLMERYRDHAPRIDPGIMWRVARLD